MFALVAALMLTFTVSDVDLSSTATLPLLAQDYQGSEIAIKAGLSATPLQDFLDEEGADVEAEFDALAPLLGLSEGSRIALFANDANNELILTFYLNEFDGLSNEEIANIAEILSGTLGPALQPFAAELRDELEMNSLVLTIVIFSLKGETILSTSINA